MSEPHDFLSKTGCRGGDKDCSPYVRQFSASFFYNDKSHGRVQHQCKCLLIIRIYQIGSRTFKGFLDLRHMNSSIFLLILRFQF